MKPMGLGVKISSGFVALIFLAVALGGLAVWNMTTVGTKVTVVAEQRVPEVQISTELIISIQQVLLQAREYGITGNPAIYERVVKQLKDVEVALDKGHAHVKKIDDGASLQAKLDAFSKKFEEYKQLIGETRTTFDAYSSALENEKAVFVGGSFFKERIGII